MGLDRDGPKIVKGKWAGRGQNLIGPGCKILTRADLYHTHHHCNSPLCSSYRTTTTHCIAHDPNNQPCITVCSQESDSVSSIKHSNEITTQSLRSKNLTITITKTAGRGGLVVGHLNVVRKDPRSNLTTAGKTRPSLRYTALGTGCAPLLQCLGRLSLPPYVGR